MPVVQYTVVPILLVSIITVIGEIIHRFGARNIAPLFIFQAMTQHAVISSMQAVNTMPLRNNACSLALGDGDLGLLWWIYTPFHLGYITCYIIAYIPSIGAFCRYNQIAPLCYYFMDALFFLAYLTMVYLRFCKSFYLRWDKCDHKTRDYCMACSAKELYFEQSKRLFVVWTGLLAFFLTQVYIFTKFNDPQFVHCSRDQKRWLLAKWDGFFIFSFAIFPTILGTAIPRVVFIRAAKESNFFKFIMQHDDDF